MILSRGGFALGAVKNIRFGAVPGGVALVANGCNATVVVNDQDWPGVIRAAGDLQRDIMRVSGVGSNEGSRATILVGTLGHSPTIDNLVREGRLNVDSIRGKWEASVTQVMNVPKRGRCLVVAGADKRGTIYAMYDISEAIGVSPWNWWADVPVKHHGAVFATGRWSAGPPAVKYRGIFLNDEAPALSNWTNANFGGYNHKFYVRVFELLLRLRANYLWPAMWNNCFSEDDPLNPQLADEYGIVMGTSHVEPMMRADKEWNRLGYTERQWNFDTHPTELEKFWTDGINRNKGYENVTTIAMRGKIDTPMSETANISLLEKIVAAQRKILAENVNPDVTQVPQLWCLYKEVQEYYEKGMRVPDDVTLLWADDNWGDIRRLPTLEERNRKGGAGVYYHFDYVGGPRNYKWIDTNPIPKVWEQTNMAYRYGANRIWVVNVGDLKPMEFPLEFFLTMARDPEAMKKEDLAGYTRRWAEREFWPEHAKEIAEIISETGRLNGRKKPELLTPGTYSLTHYGEADRVVEEYRKLTERAEQVGKGLDPAYQSAYYQLVIHPVKCVRVVTALYVAAAKNALYATQGRASANDEAARVRGLFAQDGEVTREYHAVSHGKWNHMMDQTHIGYTSWQEPPQNFMPKVVEIPVPDKAELGVATDDRESRLKFTQFGAASQSLELFNKGRQPLDYRLVPSANWIRLTSRTGHLGRDVRIGVWIDWAKLPAGTASGKIVVNGLEISVEAIKEHGRPRGFAEGDGVIAIEAEHTSRRIAEKGVSWEVIPGYGRTLSGIAPFPVLAASAEPGKGARLEYEVTTFHDGPATLIATVGPSLGFVPGRGLRVAFAFDDAAPQVVDVATAYLSRQWEKAVSDSANQVSTQHALSAGRHTLKVWAIDPGVVLERLVLDLGGLKPSFLGPPESRHVRLITR